MKRAFVYLNGSSKNGLVVSITDSYDSFRSQLIFRNNPHLNFPNLRIFSSNGCEFTDIKLIREADTIYVSNGEDFIYPEEKTTLQDRRVSGWITLNVGGRIFTTTRTTLTSKEPNSMLARMFATQESDDYMMFPSVKDNSGAYLIDRSGEYFEPILNYLRNNEIVLNKNINPLGVLQEARFYGIESIQPTLNLMVDKGLELEDADKTPLSRKDVLKALNAAPTSSQLRFQGVDLSGTDLSKLDLSNINFKYAKMSCCNLSGANLSNCLLERADLSHSNMEAAQLLGVKAMCANMEGANLKGCNLEDPNGAIAVLEGVNLRGANMEGSNMAHVNLRVATLKNANLRNCDLRSAVLAGADLENCDFSGSDLHRANLRGANLKNTAFEFMQSPLHMSQTLILQ